MTTDIKVPVLGESVTEATVAAWRKKDGDFVEMDEIICELETDKVTQELNAPVAGILKIEAQQGDIVPIGTLICRIESAGAAKSTGGVDLSKQEPAKTENKMQTETINKSTEQALPVRMTVRTVGESITEVTLAKWGKKDGDFVKLDEVIGEIDSDKATFEITAEAEGVFKAIAKEGDVLSIGAPMCEITPAAGGGASTAQTQQPATENKEHQMASYGGSENYAKGHTSPAAGKILSEKGIDPNEVKGSGKDGRITKEDAMNAKQESKPVQQPAKEVAKVAETAAPVSTPGARNTRREKMTSLRKTVSRRLVAVKNETAMLTTFNEVDMKPIMDLRAKYKDTFKEKHSIGLGFMSFFIKACSVALREFPAVNAQIDGDEIVFNDFADISIAVSAPKGLVVPIIRNAESMSFAEIEKEVIRLATRARENKLSIPEMTGGTFTITNGGVFGSLLSTPIINAPQSAILGMHNIVERPVAIGGQVVVRPMMYVALSYDHRIIDGRESVSFLVRVKQLLEDPTRLLLEV